jgi:hydroxyacylglutathione hydrolase
MGDEQPIKPANILNIVATNQGRRDVTRSRPVARGLPPERVRELVAGGHYLVDTRSSAAYGRGHIPGSLNVHLSSAEFEQRVGWVVPDDSPIILLCERDEDAQRAIYNMAFIGLDSLVTGFVQGGLPAWAEAGLAVDSVPQMDVATLAERLAENGMRVLDVREQDEWDDGHIDGCVLMPYTHLAPQLGTPPRFGELGLAKDASIAVVCHSGNRSSTAIGLMRREGYTTLCNVTGGMRAWKHARLPMVDGAGRACGI